MEGTSSAVEQTPLSRGVLGGGSKVLRTQVRGAGWTDSQETDFLPRGHLARLPGRAGYQPTTKRCPGQSGWGNATVASGRHGGGWGVRYFSTPELRKPGWRCPARGITIRASGGFGCRGFGVWRLRKCVRGSLVAEVDRRHVASQLRVKTGAGGSSTQKLRANACRSLGQGG